MKTIVITGSTKGIGYGLAEEFLKRGHNVVVSGRNQERLDKAVSTLAANYKNVAACLCDVTKYDDNEKLFAFAKEKFGRVDIWINNAGVAHPMTNVWELPLDVIQDSVNANVYGSIYGSRVAIKGMLEQGGGWIYNLEGFGSSGRTMAGLSVYGMTKAAAAFFGKSLAKEVANTSVKVATIQPGWSSPTWSRGSTKHLKSWRRSSRSSISSPTALLMLCHGLQTRYLPMKRMAP